MASPRGVPDLRQFRERPEVYVARHREAIREHDFQKRVMASWGLIARGKESIPVLLEMLHASEPESREDAAGALGWLGSTGDTVVDELCRALSTATDDEERDSIVMALGELKNAKAIPHLGALIRDDNTDGDTQWTAIRALGRIVRRRFDRGEDPRAGAIAWLEKHRAS